MIKEKFLKRYAKHDESVQEYMEMFADALEAKYNEIPDVYIVSLDILAGNLTIMSKSMSDIVNDEVGIVGKDKYRGEKKSTQLSAFMAAQHNVTKIVEKFGWTPSGAVKIQNEKSNTDIKKYIETLIS